MHCCCPNPHPFHSCFPHYPLGSSPEPPTHHPHCYLFLFLHGILEPLPHAWHMSYNTVREVMATIHQIYSCRSTLGMGFRNLSVNSSGYHPPSSSPCPSCISISGSTFTLSQSTFVPFLIILSNLHPEGRVLSLVLLVPSFDVQANQWFFFQIEDAVSPAGV